MISRWDRLEAAKEGLVLDRPAYSAWGHHYRDEWNPTALAVASTDAVIRYGFDFLKLQNRATAFAEAFGCPFIPSKGLNGQPEAIPLGAAIDRVKAAVEVSDSDVLPVALMEQVSLVRETRRLVGRNVPVIQTVFSPLSVLGYIVDSSAFGGNRDAALSFCRDNRSLSREFFGVCEGVLTRFVEESRSAGADGFFYAIMGYASHDRMRTEEYLETFVRYDELIADSMSDCQFNILHLCGDRLHFDLADRLDLHSVNWASDGRDNPTLAEAASLTRKVRMSGFNRYFPLRDGSSDDVERVIRGVRDMHDWNGAVLAPGCSVSPWPTMGSGLEAYGRIASKVL